LIRELHRYILLATTAVLLVGCGLNDGARQPAPIKEIKPESPQPAPPTTVPPAPALPQDKPGPVVQPPKPAQPPRERVWNWSGAVQPMVGRMLQVGGVSAGSVLLVDNVNNRTNGSLPTAKATQALRSALANNGTFTLVGDQQLAMAKQQLGLSAQDSLGSRSKAIGIARNVGAQYVLYTSAGGNVNSPTLQMQLMLVQTGEIVWSGKGGVERIQ
jgi:uncharacterized protein (TIGR02722 family)